jgi:hypothetical protein
MSLLERIAEERRAELKSAAAHVDWQQVILNGGPPCFYLEERGRFCLRAQRWGGHNKPNAFHRFTPLDHWMSTLVDLAATYDRMGEWCDRNDGAICDVARVRAILEGKLR